jgi:uncharacterized protein (TIGR00730 family)
MWRILNKNYILKIMAKKITPQKVSNNITLPVTLSKKDFKEVVTRRVEHVSQELTNGFNFIQGLERTATFFGSARFREKDEHYKTARELAAKLSTYGIGIVTGGGPGIMEAGNRGAFENKGFSLGLNIVLNHEQHENPYLTESMTFNYFFVRKVLLSYAAEAYVFFPGGFGTLDEFFEIITLVQTGKIERVPIILMGSDYWNELDKFIEKTVYKKHKAIDKDDRKLYIISDDVDYVADIVRHAPIRRQD